MFKNSKLLIFTYNKNRNLFKIFQRLFCQQQNNISKPKIIKILYDENNNRQITYEDIKDDTQNNKNNKKSLNTKSKLKIFGEHKIEKGNNNNNNDYSEEQREAVNENMINYDQYFSDNCRIYIKAGDGGNGSCSIIKGPMFDQSKIYNLNIILI
jgi:hypothetical protein